MAENKYRRKIIDTNHAIDRFVQRYKFEFARYEVDDVIYKAMNKIVEEYNDKRGIYVVWSKSTHITVVINWRPYYKSVSQVNHAIIVTLPPIKRSFSDLRTTEPDDIKIMVESFIKKTIISHNPKLKESSHKYIQKDNSLGFDIFMENGEIYDYGIDHYIVID